MKTNYFNPNWYMINKAIDANNLTELRKQQNELKKKIQDRIDVKIKERAAKEAADKVSELKNLPIGSDVYYFGRSVDIPFGAVGQKVKDGRTRMEVSVNGKNWGIYYVNLKPVPPTAEEKTSRKVTNRIVDLLNS